MRVDWCEGCNWMADHKPCGCCKSCNSQCDCEYVTPRREAPSRIAVVDQIDTRSLQLLNLDECRMVLVWAAEQVEYPVEEVERIRLTWNGRFTARFGDACPAKHQIRLSKPLWPRMPISERHETVVHELCHMAHAYLYPKDFYARDRRTGKRKNIHGKVWRDLMNQCGYAGKRTGYVDPTGLVNSRSIHIKCGCGFVHALGPKRVKKAKEAAARGHVLYRCKTCRSPVLPE